MAIIKGFLSIIPIMFYYLIESFFVSVFINTAWKHILQPQFSIQLSYIHWVFIIWIIKVVLFDPIKLAVDSNKNITFNNKNTNQEEIDES